jgi:hypothetical protein
MLKYCITALLYSIWTFDCSIKTGLLNLKELTQIVTDRKNLNNKFALDIYLNKSVHFCSHSFSMLEQNQIQIVFRNSLLEHKITIAA